MAEPENPFSPPDEERLAASDHRGPAPQDVEAAFIGAGKAGQTWKLQTTAARLYLSLEGSQDGFSMPREEVADALNVGSLSSTRATLIFKRPRPHILTFEPSALEHVYAWLGGEAARFRRRILRSGWVSTLFVGLVFLVPLDLHVGARYIAWLTGGLHLVSALASRFAGSSLGFLLRALASLALAAYIVYNVVYVGWSPWLSLLAALMIFPALRSWRLYSFFAAERRR